MPDDGSVDGTDARSRRPVYRGDMRRGGHDREPLLRRQSMLSATVAVAAAGAGLAWPSAAASQGIDLRISPMRGTLTTKFTITYRAPWAVDLAYSGYFLEVRPADRRLGCDAPDWFHEFEIRRGERKRFTLSPRNCGPKRSDRVMRRWRRGTYRARIYWIPFCPDACDETTLARFSIVASGSTTVVRARAVPRFTG